MEGDMEKELPLGLCDGVYITANRQGQGSTRRFMLESSRGMEVWMTRKWERCGVGAGGSKCWNKI